MLVTKLPEKRATGETSLRWDNKIEINLRETGCDTVA
jgi:hypothetical protein